MQIIFIGIWLALTITIYKLYCKMYPIRIHTDIINDNLKEILGSAVAALIVIVLCFMVFEKYIQIIVPAIVIIITIIFYKKTKNNKSIIIGMLIALIAFGAVTYLKNSSVNNSKTKSVEENKSTEQNNDVKSTKENKSTEQNNDVKSTEENKSTEQNNNAKSTEENKSTEQNNDVKSIISKNVEGYIYGFVDDVNSGNANECLNYLEHNSELYNEQIKNIPEISRQFNEKVVSIEVKDIKQIAENKYSVQVIENIDINKKGGESKEKQYENSYVVVKIGSNFLIRSMNQI